MCVSPWLFHQRLPGCFVLAMVMVHTSMASTVVLFVAAMLMAVMMVVVTVRAELASRSSRHQIPSCLFRETHSKASLCSTQGCKPPVKPKHWHIIFTPFSKFMPVCPTVCPWVCLAVRLCLFICLFECHYSELMYLKAFVNIQCP